MNRPKAAETAASLYLMEKIPVKDCQKKKELD